LELQPTTLRGVGRAGEQIEGPAEMSNGFGHRGAPDRKLSGLVSIAGCMVDEGSLRTMMS
jgi:hypothetical protein